MIVIVATLDSKGEKAAYMRQVIESKGGKTLVIDCGVMGKPHFKADISRQQVAEAAGTTINDLRSRISEEARAMRIMAQGASKIVLGLYSAGRLDGLLGVGGTMGTSLFLTVSNTLPMGVPKVIYSTTAFSPYLRPTLIPPDLIMIPAVSDIWGLDTLSKRALENAAATILAVSQVYKEGEDLRDRNFIGISTLGTSALKYIIWLKPLLEDLGNEVVAFHVGGGQGWSFERLLRQGLIKGVLDLCVIDVCPDNIAKQGFLSMAKRLETAAELGIPQIVAPGSLCEIIWPKSPDELPARFRNRIMRQHNDLVWTTERSLHEAAETANIIASALNKGTGPRAIVIPARSTSTWDEPGLPYYNPKRIKAFTKAIKTRLHPNVELVELDLSINDRIFAEEVARLYASLVSKNLTAARAPLNATRDVKVKTDIQ